MPTAVRRSAAWRYCRVVTDSDQTHGGQTADGEPEITEEQMREYLARLRETPAEQLLAEVLSSLLNTAQAKLGRRDARLLIDLSGMVADHVREHVSDDLTGQVDQALTQLRNEQVRAESAGDGQEPNDLAQTPQSPGGGQGPSGSSTSALWVPGQG